FSLLGTITVGTDLSLSQYGDITVGTFTIPGTLSLTSTHGAIIDGNGPSLNITAAHVVLSAATGIGDGDALETTVGTIVATNSTSGNIELIETDGVSLGTISNPGRDFYFTAGGNVTQTGTITAAKLQLVGFGPGDFTLTNSNDVATLAADIDGDLAFTT